MGPQRRDDPVGTSNRDTTVITSNFKPLLLHTCSYSVTLVAVLHLSVLRSAALSGFGQALRKRFELVGLMVVIGILLIRLVRTGFIFYQTTQSSPVPALSTNSTTLQVGVDEHIPYFACRDLLEFNLIITLMPALFLRFILDVWSLFNLYRCRVKYVEQAGKEAFNIIIISLLIEFVLSMLAIIVGMQEALVTPGDRLAFMDWLLFSWCLASWVEQRPLYMLIFGMKITTSSHSENGSTHGAGTAKSANTNRDIESGHAHSIKSGKVGKA
ncbi:hypothetical protein HDU67_007806 [Dinochytrium kinnereticum]|nr:hypothetical protein HDU67_007806 [Dinochytrium kinnereticum]